MAYLLLLPFSVGTPELHVSRHAMFTTRLILRTQITYQLGVPWTVLHSSRSLLLLGEDHILSQEEAVDTKPEEGSPTFGHQTLCHQTLCHETLCHQAFCHQTLDHPDIAPPRYCATVMSPQQCCAITSVKISGPLLKRFGSYDVLKIGRKRVTD